MKRISARERRLMVALWKSGLSYWAIGWLMRRNCSTVGWVCRQHDLNEEIRWERAGYDPDAWRDGPLVPLPLSAESDGRPPVVAG